MPKPELVSLDHLVCSLPSKKLPMSLIAGSPSVVRVLGDSRSDGRLFVQYQALTIEVLMQRIRQAYVDVFSMVEVTTLVEYCIPRLKGALYDDWTEPCCSPKVYPTGIRRLRRFAVCFDRLN